MSNNSKNKLHFTELLCEMLKDDQLELLEALKIISQETESGKKTVTAKTAAFLLEIMSMGWTFSYGLKICEFIRFDKTYISFAGFAEKTGSLKNCMDFLRKKLVRRKENLSQVCGALAYPVFVILLSVLMGGVLVKYWKQLVQDMESYGNNLRACLVLAILVLFMFGVAIGVVINGIFKTNLVQEAFLAVDFLCCSGVNLSDSVETAALIFGPETKEGVFFENIREKLSSGLSISEALDCRYSGWGNKAVWKRIQNEFYYVERMGGKNIAFGKIAAWLENRDVKRKKIFFRMIEPLSILGTGGFILIFLMTLVMPLISGNYLGV